jgi:glycosyltransferase involved in cell wall biosynthesis
VYNVGDLCACLQTPSYFVGTAPSTMAVGVPVIILPAAAVGDSHLQSIRDIACQAARGRARVHAGAGPGAALSLLYVGRLDPEKSAGLLVKAVAMVAAELQLEHGSIQLHVVGAGRLLSGLHALARQLLAPLGVNVTFHGPRSRSQVAALVLAGGSAVDLLVNPRMSGETYGLTHVEAALLQLPVLAFRRRANSESVSAVTVAVAESQDEAQSILLDGVSFPGLVEGILAFHQYNRGRLQSLRVGRAQAVCERLTAGGDSAATVGVGGTTQLISEPAHRRQLHYALWAIS